MCAAVESACQARSQRRLKRGCVRSLRNAAIASQLRCALELHLPEISVPQFKFIIVNIDKFGILSIVLHGIRYLIINLYK